MLSSPSVCILDLGIQTFDIIAYMTNKGKHFFKCLPLRTCLKFVADDSTLIQDIDRYGAAAEGHAGIVVFHAEVDAVAEDGSAGIFGPATP
mgnify:CR=1 FL=1